MATKLKILTNTYGLSRIQCGSCLVEIDLPEPNLHGRDVQCRCGQRLELVSYRTIDQPAELERYIADFCVPARSTSFDYETTSLNVFDCKVVGVSLGPEDRLAEAVYIPVRHRIGDNMEPSAMESIIGAFIRDYPVNAHGADFEYRISVIHLKVEPQIVCDTMIEAFLDDSNRKSRFDSRGVGLKDMCRELFWVDMIDFRDLIDPNKQDFSYFPVRQATLYGSQDSDFATRLKRKLFYRNSGPQEAGGQPYIHYLEHELVPITAEMELRGVLLDPNVLEDARPVLMAELEKIENRIRELAGEPNMQVDVASPNQMADLLFNKMMVPFDEEFVGKPSKAWPAGQPGTGKKALELLKADYEIVELVLDGREIKTALSAYVDKLPGMCRPETGTIHCSFVQDGTPTGRYACKEPNLQAISKVRD